ncbi:hypothetical protein HY417_03320 [Candidatus Kaiserbacteria bacterium]|nr:hypothetical protein [Candidatus Kaiserbacteria bacterium]
MAQVWKRFLTERSKTDLRFRALKEKLDASTPKGIDYIDTTKTLKNLAIAIVEEAKLSDKKCITIAVADESLIKDKNEENPALIHALEKLIGNDMKVEAITVQTLWQKLESDPTRAASMLLFADYTPAELEEACSTSGLDHSAVSSAFNKIATLGPHSIEADTDRDWLISLGLSPDDHELFQEVIAEREIEVAGDTVRHNGTIIDLRKYVLKRMGTFGGKGIFLPDAPNPNERLTSTTVSKLKMEGAKFYLEKHVTGPKTLQPMIITPRPITEPGYAAKPSGYVGEFTVDSRVTFMCDPKGMITPVSLFGRFNYSFRPDNIGSGGGLVPVIIVRDDAYNETIESMGSFLGDLSENDVQEWYSVLERRLGNRGFKVYGNTITFGMMPHIISESAYLSMVSAAKKVGEHILARHSDLKNSFLFAIDTYVDPRPNSERSYENAG